MQFDREKRQKKIKDNLELHQDTRNTIKGMADKLTSLNKSADEVEENLKEKFLYYYPDTRLSELVNMKWKEVISRFIKW